MLRAGIEPARPKGQQIFVPLYIAIATEVLWSGLCLNHIFRLRLLVYSLYTFILLKEKFSTAFCVCLRRLASFYSKGFPLGTLYNSLQLVVTRNTPKSVASACSAIGAYYLTVRSY